LTLFLSAIAIGVLFGGVLADKTARHDLVLYVTYTISMVSLMAISLGALPFWAIACVFVLAGLMRGVVNPSRDILVRQAAPAGAIGAVFGFVSTGFNIGQGSAPLLYGWFMDIGSPDLVFWAAAGFTAIAISIVVFSGERKLKLV
jgi:predicted MFS family arabinose efflux permease